MGMSPKWQVLALQTRPLRSEESDTAVALMLNYAHKYAWGETI